MSGLDPAGMRRLNVGVTLASLRRTDGITLSRLAKETGLSRRTTEVILESLMNDGYARIVEGPSTSDARPLGRPARVYEFVADSMLVAGVVIIPEAVHVGISDLNGEIRAQATLATSTSLGRQARLDSVVRAVNDALAAGGLDAGRLSAVSVATIGPVRDNGEVDLRMTLPEWTGFSIPDALSDPLGCDVLVENDAKLGAVGERWKGVARGADNLIWVWNDGHRSGVGIVIDGRLYRGLDGRSGEIVWAGDLSLIRGSNSVLGDLNAPSPADGRGLEAVLDEARRGKRAAQAQVTAIVDEIQDGMAALIWTLAPQVVVLGPSLDRAADLIVPALRERLQRDNEVIPLVCGSSLGSWAVMYGAIRRALDHVESTLLPADFPGARPFP